MLAIKIKCPACAHEMSLKTVKTGSFKPACTGCKANFQLVVGEGDPPAIKVAKLAASKAPTIAEVERTIEHNPAERNPTQHSLGTKSDQKEKQSATPQITRPDSQGSFSDATIDADSDSAAATRAKQSAGRSQSFTVDADATIDSQNVPAANTLRAGSQSTPQVTNSALSSIGTPTRLGGYRILKELGRGGMGSVYLAKQLSLDRNVAVKTILGDWSKNPRVIARFIREAYAAAQLTHHNVVQIYDLGQDNATNYFSMELVEGGSLDDLLKRKGSLPPTEAATYILQAARGLRFAHEHGMIHRDIKPANLMLTRDCLVKVADLGLVKTPAMSDEEQTTGEDENLMLSSARSQVTGLGSTLGTPAYMAPEQAEDATSVDHRADIYSLGCTFYALLAGKPPYGGMSAIEILSKIKTEPIARVDKVVSGIPTELGTIIEKMTAKLASERYASLDVVIQALESYLAGATTTSVGTAKQHADSLADAAQQLHQVPAARLRKLFPLVVTGVCGLGILTGLFFSFRLALMSVLVLLLTPILITLITTLCGGRSPITSRLRAMLVSSSIGDWVTWSVGGLVLLVAAWVLGMIGWSLAALMVAAVLAAAYFSLVSRPIARQRQAALALAADVLRQMRLEGKDEVAVSRFVAEFSGPYWEELFESLFDYELLRQMRRELSGAGKLRNTKRFQPWRDALIDRIDIRLKALRDDRERRVLTKVEAASLKAAGVSGQEAEHQAAAMADSLVAAATQTRVLSAASLTSTNTNDAAAKRERIKQMLVSARSGKPQTMTAKASRATGALLEQLFGSKLRFVVGACLIAGSVLWANQNNLLDKERLAQVGQTVQSGASNLTEGSTNLKSGQAAAKEVTQQVGQLMRDTKPLSFSVVGGFFTSLAPGVIGLLIMLSAFAGSWRLSIMALIGAAIALLGPSLGVPSLGITQGSAWISCGIGIALLCVPILLKPLR